jgi:hypothetical protein
MKNLILNIFLITSALSFVSCTILSLFLCLGGGIAESIGMALLAFLWFILLVLGSFIRGRYDYN